ncbi:MULTISPECIES: acetyltransferase [unclassified Mycolicibacterium]|uniref:acetyltransferase n=1 Tax=unclassified Mycolicibacterium TaxID=2636767 RepID=UPI0013084690|nr:MULTISPECIES: acetyltransferase [unclassified Mycolicibacterium]MUL82924.1 acetyltransferase [Mycolicibacterium sp. CBMA 329]MUL89259.1 acetyltransferase [Mycolicibacterium sp. CBMA 331]MUL97826.1 acetyltransferase [Mycolicibacterium sp. CBMA 334]MUM30232.1 acetyltransferase [Mycolicibacterium sp. CBMA 295]MUM38775.1 acetyltransferase [Mycolicibacterium sp. CBMA 247]
MTARITPLRLEGFEQLPKHARRCVFWEVDPSTVGDDHLTDPEFEKEAWLSMVMLEWGSCGQLAVPVRSDAGQDAGRDSGSGAGNDVATPAAGDDLVAAAAGYDVAAPASFDDPCVGFAFYAPPGAVPRARLFPTAPVSADAILLTAVGVEAGEDSEWLSQSLLAAVVNDLVRRGVRALEAFGYTAAVTELADCGKLPAELAPVVEVLGDCTVDKCMLDSDFLEDVGFTVVAPHPYFPRLRLELDKGLGWKADVEAALERLLENARIELPIGAGMSAAGVGAKNIAPQYESKHTRSC